LYKSSKKVAAARSIMSKVYKERYSARALKDKKSRICMPHAPKAVMVISKRRRRGKALKNIESLTR
jgi:hypothetical protein